MLRCELEQGVEPLPFQRVWLEMIRDDPTLCRRALREIGEIAAVAVLQDSQMTDQEALQMIGAIADWVWAEDGGAAADCSGVIRRLHQLTSGVDLDRLDDPEAVALFGQVQEALSS